MPARADIDSLAAAAGADATAVHELASLLGGAGEDIVVVWGERLAGGPRAGQAGRALLNVAARLGLAGDGAGLLEVPSAANGRGLREAGFLPDAGPGLAEASAAGRSAAEIARALDDGEVSALWLLHADPLRTHPDRGAWERGLERATAVIAHASVLTEGLAEHATVVFPAESYAEKEGTVTHPDGRVQRLRPAIGRPAEVRAGWRVIGELAERVGHPLGVLTSAGATAALAAAVPFYAGLTPEEIGGRGVRWQERDAAAGFGETPRSLPRSSRPRPPRPRPTARCAWARSARSGRPPRSRSRPR